MKLKTLAILSGILMLGLMSCSDDKDEVLIDGNEAPKDTALKLIATKTIIEPFEKLTVRIDLDEELIYTAYDSVTWDAAGTWWDGIITIPNNEDPRDVHFTNYRLGKHKIILKGYRDGEVISSPSVEYEVISPRGDFLNVRWAETEKFNSVDFRSGRTPLNYLPTTEGWTKIGGVRIARWHIADSKKGEYVDLHLEPWSFSTNLRLGRSLMPDVPNIEDFDWNPEKDESWEEFRKYYTQRCKKETEFLYNYMIALYGKPILEHEGDDPTKTTLWADYDERFNNKPRDGAYPCVIWETPSSYIAMNHHPNSILNNGTFKGLPAILAEPRYKK